MKKIGRRIWHAASRLLLALAVFLIAALLFVSLSEKIGGRKTKVLFEFSGALVLTGSMSGTIEPHDYVITHRQSTYETGDIIRFYDGETTVTHRIIEVRHTESGQRVYRTKGDANNTPDSGERTDQDIVGKVIAVLPWLGTLLWYMRAKPWTVCLLAATVFLIWGIQDRIRQKGCRGRMKKIAILLAEGFEEIEGLTVVDILRRAGLEAVTVSITKEKQVTGSHRIGVLADQVITDTEFTSFDGIVLPGGMPGTRHLGENSIVAGEIRTFAQDGKLVAAICAAPSVLGEQNILQGKQAVCYPGFEEKLLGAKVGTEPVVVDHNVITSRGMGTAIPFALAIVEYFLGADKAEEIGASILYEGTAK